MLVTLVLSNKVKSIQVEVKAHKGLHCQDEVRQVEGVLDLLAVNLLDF
jgi:hypothetical protein